MSMRSLYNNSFLFLQDYVGLRMKQGVLFCGGQDETSNDIYLGNSECGC